MSFLVPRNPSGDDDPLVGDRSRFTCPKWGATRFHSVTATCTMCKVGSIDHGFHLKEE